MAETLLVNPRKRKKKKTKKRKARRNTALVNPRKKRRKARRNPFRFKKPKVGVGDAIASVIGGTLQGLSEKLLTLFKKKDGNPVIPGPIRNVAFPVVSFIGSGMIPKGEEVTLGAIGAAGEKVSMEILKKVLPQNIKSRFGLEGIEISGLGELTPEDVAYLNKMIPYVMAYRHELEKHLSEEPIKRPQARQINQPGFPGGGMLPGGGGLGSLDDISAIKNLSIKLKN
jgi:hypothetical protein